MPPAAPPFPLAAAGRFAGDYARSRAQRARLAARACPAAQGTVDYHRPRLPGAGASMIDRHRSATRIDIYRPQLLYFLGLWPRPPATPAGWRPECIRAAARGPGRAWVEASRLRPPARVGGANARPAKRGLKVYFPRCADGVMLLLHLYNLNFSIMAKILFTAFMADARGKVAGTVFSKNRSGAYTRTKVTPTNRRTDAQMLQRSALGLLSANWRALTESQRAGWNAAVENFQRTNVFGNLLKPSGLNLFVGLNKNLANIGLAPMDDAPQPAGLPDSTLLELVAGVGNSSFKLDLQPSVDFSILIFATPPQSPGREYLRGWRLLNADGTQPTPSGTGPYIYAFGAMYEAAFGDPIMDAKMGVRVVFVNRSTGEASVPQQATAIIGG